MHALRKEIARLRLLVLTQADAVDALSRTAANNLRRIGELQHEVDTLRKALNRP